MGKQQKSRVNDFVLKIANVNGTGSASANSLLMKAVFRMGVPVSGKNFFPSNIQGLPTWYEIRVSKDGYLARSGAVDIMVAMNAQTYARDLQEVAPGGVLLYDSTWPRDRLLSRTDIEIFGVPLARMCNERFANARTRILMKNMAYVGVLAALLELDRNVIVELVKETFAKKPALIESNQQAIDLGFEYARAHLPCPLPQRVKPLGKTAGHIMIDGNTAAALGCVYAGATVGAWYPITPSTSLMDAFKSFCERYRKDPQTGERRYCVVQAEDELAAIGIVLGATWNGARAFTPTSGPGLSLMSEFLGFAYFTELPAVLFDVQRVGPSTGMPTRTQQADLLAAAYASHGDTKHVLLFPRDPRECFELAVTAFDLADRLQTPVIVLSDLDIGMNDWMCTRARLGPRLPARSRQGAVGRAARSGEGVPPLRRRRRRRHPAAHAAGRAPARRVLRARLGPQPVRRLHRGRRGVPASRRSAREEMADGGEAGARARDSPFAQGRAARHRRDRQLRRRRRGSARPARAPKASTPTTAASGRSRSARRSGSSSSSTSACSSSSRIATRS